ncbi:MAG: flavodoxin [Rubrivivax sp.]|nr:MAG: flavodoxin [Rubrivivax sp.]
MKNLPPIPAEPDVNRRDSLRTAFALALPGAAATASAPAAAQPATRATTLVAFLSRSGNTRVIAGQIRRAKGADLFEIQPAPPYPEDYLEHVEQARQETLRGHRPTLAQRVQNLSGYATVYLGFPIWGETMPPPVRSFLAEHDLAGKTVIPFITHGGYGVGASLSVLTRDAPGARIGQALVMQADQERATLERVTQWLGGRMPARTR